MPELVLPSLCLAEPKAITLLDYQEAFCIPEHTLLHTQEFISAHKPDTIVVLSLCRDYKGFFTQTPGFAECGQFDRQNAEVGFVRKLGQETGYKIRYGHHQGYGLDSKVLFEGLEATFICGPSCWSVLASAMELLGMGIRPVVVMVLTGQASRLNQRDLCSVFCEVLGERNVLLEGL